MPSTTTHSPTSSGLALAFHDGDLVWVAAAAAQAEQPYAEGVVSGAPSAGAAAVAVKLQASGAVEQLPPSRLSRRNDPSASLPDDHCGLTELSEATLLANTLRRAAGGRFCTWVGPNQLVAVNPCRQIAELKGEAKHRSFLQKRDVLEPHAYAVAELAVSSLHRRPCVAIMVSGESGAGKTENNRLVVEHLVWRCGGGAADSGGGGKSDGAAAVRERVLQSSSVLENLGNAAMAANPNSSRFGKFVSLLFSGCAPGVAPEMVGARVDSFLLEKCRVAAFARGQRNFHALYELVAAQPAVPGGGADGAGATYGAMDDFAFLCDETTRAERFASPDKPAARTLARGRTGLAAASAPAATPAAAAPNAYGAADAAAGYARLRAGLVALGASEAGLGELVRSLRAVLLLGQLTFAESDDGAVAIEAPPSGGAPSGAACLGELEATCAVGGGGGGPIDARLLNLDILSPRTGRWHAKPITAREAAQARDALATSLYSAAFDEVVELMNHALRPTKPGGGGGGGGGEGEGEGDVGLLDVFGFEVLPLNSFEQLCINYCNERLHAHYLACTALEERRLHALEGLPWTPPADGERSDNRLVLEVLEGKAGVFACLESTCRAKGAASDVAFNRSLLTAQAKSRLLGSPRKLSHDAGFVLAHFHSAVQYQTHGWIDKNKDSLSPSLVEVIAARADALRKGFGLPEATPRRRSQAMPAASAKGASAAPATVSEKYKLHLKALLSELSPQLRPAFFIKCVKPNPSLAPDAARPASVLRQLRAQGVLDGVALIKRGFPHRIPYADVHARYAPLLEGKYAKLPPQALVEAVVTAQGLRPLHEYALGSERIFLRLGKAALLEEMLSRPPQQMLPQLLSSLELVLRRRQNRAVIGRAVWLWVLRRRARESLRKRKAARRIQRMARGRIARFAVAARREEAEAERAAQAAIKEAEARVQNEAARARRAATTKKWHGGGKRVLGALRVRGGAYTPGANTARAYASAPLGGGGGGGGGASLSDRGGGGLSVQEDARRRAERVRARRAQVGDAAVHSEHFHSTSPAKGGKGGSSAMSAAGAAARAAGGSRKPPPGVAAVAAQLEPPGSEASAEVAAQLILEPAIHRVFFAHWPAGWHAYEAVASTPAAGSLTAQHAALLAGLNPPWRGGRHDAKAEAAQRAARERKAAAAKAAAGPAAATREEAAAAARDREAEDRRLLGGDGRRKRIAGHLRAFLDDTAPEARVRQVLGLGVIASCFLCYVMLLGPGLGP